MPAGSVAPTATFVQVPAALAEALHDLQVLLHSVEQQTPCLQKLDLHSLSAEQVRPGSLRPHEPLVQTAGGSQSELLEHAALHAAEPHRYGKQETAAGFTQVPAPSQVDVAVKVAVADGQVADAQDDPLAYFWQAPAWHLPLVPQLVAP